MMGGYPPIFSGLGMETLREKQSRFAELAALLILQAIKMGYAVTLGDAFRSPEEARRLWIAGKGSDKSLHCERLAIDLNLFKDGEYLTKTEDYAPLGEWWESIGGAWGGRIRRGDGNHFSLAHGGRV